MQYAGIQVWGDSVLKGVVYDPDRSRYTLLKDSAIQMLADTFRLPFENLSRMGRTAPEALLIMQSMDSVAFKDKLVVIEYGGNDCDFDWGEVAANPEKSHEPKTELGLFEKTLTETILAVQKEEIVPVLMTLPPLDPDRYLEWVSKYDPLTEQNILKWLGSVAKIYWWQERYSPSILTVAEKTDTRWIDIRGAFLRSPRFSDLLCRDGIHPNREGHLLIADTIVDYISDNYASLLSEEGVSLQG